MAGPDGTGLKGETAVGAGYIIDQADLKSRRQSGVFCFWVPCCTPRWSDDRLIWPSHHSVGCLPLYRFHLRELHLFPSLEMPGLAFLVMT